MKIKVGDIITAYHKGYHRVDEIKPRENPPTPNNFLVYYTKVANNNGKPSRKSKNCCHIDYCDVLNEKHIEYMYSHDLAAAEIKKKNLLKVLKENE